MIIKLVYVVRIAILIYLIMLIVTLPAITRIVIGITRSASVTRIVSLIC